MREQLLLLVRVSKPEYNRTLYNDYYLQSQANYYILMMVKKHGNCFVI